MHAVVLAIVQGLSEFLPISSSGHLILVPHFLGWQDQGLAFDVALHVGTLTAVLLYFRSEVVAMAVGWTRSVTGGPATADSRLAWNVIIGTIPVGLVGLAFSGWIEENLRSPLFVAGTLTVFGVLLWIADVRGRRERKETELGWRDALFIGCAQSLALMPGTSRSGVTMTAGLMAGLTRHAAARFSFLLAIPSTGLAGGYEMLKLLQSPAPVDWTTIGLGIAVAAITALACVHWLLTVIGRMGFWPFTVYRLVLAAVIVVTFA